ncbi:MAG: LysM peptidoglycan-binding domain-containing protein [Anaerolineae bacterium]|nr:LysM peptidoglycan-binding domain-containing protein [Anaerolineae bacterium]MCB9132495.1 LysM peptidoglycan-binding domain-containing protein [Anaerolineales bacterium]MCB0244512.1 LysM peptidoglycan-binding domain-containing protein [Anaerolineae bacterium]MCB0248544.1 LysM peptidoglycan-binding domain-containing protein [Anaerolineae bacterium]MCB9143033.1 LysM peptidoglycan-binding domain-containing protein [Anaerolineales bacterium]
MISSLRRTPFVLLSLILIVGLLSACQRDRPAAEAPDWNVTPSPAAGVTADASPVANATTTVVVAATSTTPGAVVVATPLATTESAIVVATPTVETVAVPVGPTFGYIVKAGDTLSSIALTYDTEVQIIRTLNNLPDDSIQVGQVLVVPGTGGSAAGTGGDTTAPEPTATPGFIYTVQSGDSLTGIATELGVDWRDIATVNNIEGPNYTIFRGQKLVVPGITATPVPTAEVRTHVITAGDTLSSIAVQYGVTVEAIMQANQITNPNLINTGQELIIP